MPDDRDLIRRYCRENDQQAFRNFYRRHSGRLWRFLVARGSDSEQAYDLLSETFLRFVRAVCRDPRAPVAFLYRIAVNLHIDNYRRRQASPLEADSALVEQAAAPFEDPGGEHAYVRELIKTLHSDEQNLLRMRYWIGLTHREIAGIIGLPEGTVRRQAAAALKKLQQRWQEDT